jgi:hypothetical protein
MAVAPRFLFQNMILLVSRWHADSGFSNQMIHFELGVAKKRSRHMRKTIAQGPLSKLLKQWSSCDLVMQF